MGLNMLNLNLTNDMARKDTEGIIKEVLDTLKECIEYEEYAVEYECMGEDQLNRLKTIQEKLKKL